MVNADPARTPTLAMFAKPDYFLHDWFARPARRRASRQNTGFAYDHGDYAAEIDTNYFGIAGPGVRSTSGVDGSAACGRAELGRRGQRAGHGAGQRYQGTWIDETDIRPTMMYLAGLRDDYEHDGRVITQILSRPEPRAVAAPGWRRSERATSSSTPASASSVPNPDSAATKAIESTSPGDAKYLGTSSRPCGCLSVARDRLALRIKGELEAAAFGNRPIHDVLRADRGLQAHSSRPRTCWPAPAEQSRA